MYIYWLAFFSIAAASLERFWPARDQNMIRKWLWSDAVHLIFNGHFFGVVLYGISFHRVVPYLEGFLRDRGWLDYLYFGAVSDLGIVLQSAIALVVLDLVQWSVHKTLHKYSFLWRIHQVHHSVKDGEMDWIVSFRFSWVEPVIYKVAMYVPAMWFGFAPEALFFHAVVGTLVGHLNHSNTPWKYGLFKYLINTPHMHLYHHAYSAPAKGHNFGIIFSCWDWIFGTAHFPDEPCQKIGFPGVELMPNDFFGQVVWPLPLWIPSIQRTNLFVSVAGIIVLAVLYAASLPPSI